VENDIKKGFSISILGRKMYTYGVLEHYLEPINGLVKCCKGIGKNHGSVYLLY
jgi:hypothetical protein